MEFPHARGGVSSGTSCDVTGAQVSPRTWGCFLKNVARTVSGVSFPTHVGVFLSTNLFDLIALQFPHARGGVSIA